LAPGSAVVLSTALATTRIGAGTRATTDASFDSLQVLEVSGLFASPPLKFAIHRYVPTSVGPYEAEV
jgi:hypothetical protein